MPIDPQRVEELFLAATELPAAERPGYLEKVCGSDAKLRAAVERLLAAHVDPATIFKPMLETSSEVTSASAEATGAQTQQPDIGTVLAGRYTLLDEIGEGGMGTVWMARQTEPVKRMVAVKLIKPGMDSKAVLARFEAERQALALMDHPNIARVLDAGVSADGHPFFVMDLVKGVPITQFCDARKLTPRERLELFVPVCHAIQHAHQKGIIHRDIKPSNVLVAMYDDRAIPKVIDFGVAKATGQQLTERTFHTGFGTVLGTPQYMSPEQAAFNNLDIDTRSDLYSLGVLLYELLAGSPPFTKQELEVAGVLEMLRVVREQEPPRPSTRLSTADALPTLAANRGTEPKKLTGILRNELDWIVMKALEKDRTRRYETANGFAADVLRYLAGEPVRAVPPSTRYRLQKFVRKNRGSVITAAAIALLLVLGVAGNTWQTVRAMHAESQARQATEVAVQARKDESARAENERMAKQIAQEAIKDKNDALSQALKRLSQIEKGNAILTSIFENLNVWRVREGIEPLEAVLAKRLIKAARELEGDAVGDPLAVAALQERLGNSLLSLGYPKDATPLLIKARDTRLARLGEDAPETVSTARLLALAYRDDGKFEIALQLFEQILKSSQEKKGAEHDETLASLSDLGLCLWYAGKHQLAAPLLEEVLRIQKSRPDVDRHSINDGKHYLALCYLSGGKFDQALPLFQETLEFRKKETHPSNPNTFTSMNDLAFCHYRMRQFDLALPLFVEALNLRKERLGADHPATLLSMANLAMCYSSLGKYEESVLLLQKLLELRRGRDGDKHPRTIDAMWELGLCYRDAGKAELAIQFLEETVKLSKQVNGTSAEPTIIVLSNLAACHRSYGRLDRAQTFFEEAALELEKQKFQLRCATIIIRDTIECLEQLGNFEHAANWRRKWLPVVNERDGADSGQYASQLAALGFDLLQVKKWKEADEVLIESLHIREKIEPEAWTTFDALSMRGEALLGLGKVSDAKLLILKGYAGLKERKKTIPTSEKDKVFQAMERMARFYEITGENELAAKLWREVPLRAKPEENLIKNGSFEEGPEVSNYLALDEGSIAMPGWVVTRGQIDLTGDFWVAASGKRSIDLHGSPGFGGVAQKFKTQKGKRYQVVFSLAGSVDAKPVKRTAVTAAGQMQEFRFDSTGKTRDDMGWEKMVWEFEAIADETTLEIYTLETTDEFAGPTIDDVWVLPVPVKR